jgi:hypothetical protein
MAINWIRKKHNVTKKIMTVSFIQIYSHKTQYIFALHANLFYKFSEIDIG